MTTKIYDNYKTLIPTEGMMLTDGTTISDMPYLPLSADETKWYEISIEEAERLQKELEEKAMQEVEIPVDHSQEIAELKKRLADTDYCVIKIAEGVATKEEYADIIAERAELRMRINEMEQQTSMLK